MARVDGVSVLQHRPFSPSESKHLKPPMSIVRFAPSPTGNIHIGNVRTALFNWLWRLKTGGSFILRFDDTDVARSRQEYADNIARDLQWLGITPDRVEYQSKRKAAHDAAVDTLKAKGLLYPCYETADELERKRKLRLSRRLPPVYGREALQLTDEEKARLSAEGRSPHWRFLLPNHDGDPMRPRRTDVTWDDLIRGPQSADLASLSDPVLIREDGTYLYTLPSVVDDIDMGVTTIIRGDDHVTNTAVQLALFNALGAPEPQFGHHNLLTNATGEGLSKRTGALSVASLREAGHEPRAIAALAVLTGTASGVSVPESLEAMAETFTLEGVSKSAAKFDPADLDGLTASITHELSFEAARERLRAVGIEGENAEAFWLAVRRNCTVIADARRWWALLSALPDDRETLNGDDLAFARTAFSFLPDGAVTHDTWGEWTARVKAETGRKGRALVMPRRVALTGSTAGPELSDLLPLLGREEILARRP